MNVNPSAGWKANEWLALGAGVDMFFSTLELRSLMPFGQARAETSGFGLGANAGATLTVAEGHRIALTYRSPVSVDYDGDFKLRGATPPGLADSDFETEIDFPDIAVLAYGAEITESVRGEVAVEWIGWSSMKALPVDAGPNQPLAGPPSVPYDWDDTWTINAGFDWAFASQWIARAGYSYVPSPVPSRTFSPLLPDADRHIVALGLGYQDGRHAVDLVWTLNFVDDRTIAGNQVPPFDGVYEIDPQLIALSYRYLFN